MPVIQKDTELAYVGNGATTVFAFDFEVVKASHFEAIVAGAVVIDYTLAGLGVDTGGTCTFTTAPVNAATVVLRRKVPYDRTDFDYQTLGEFAALTVDDDLDRVVMQVQQLATLAKRTPRTPIGNLTLGLDLVPAASKLLAWNGAATALVNVDVATVTPTGVVMTAVGQSVVTAATISGLRNLIGANPTGPVNVGLAASVNAGALTVSAVGFNGSAHAANNLGVIPFRSATNGLVDVVELSTALTITMPSGAELGVKNNNEPFHIWVACVKTAGGLTLALIRPLQYLAGAPFTAASSMNIKALDAIGTLTGSLTAPVSAGSDAPLTFYGVSLGASDPYTVLGYIEYTAGLPAIGVWSAVPSLIVPHISGSPLPGDVLYTTWRRDAAVITGTTLLPIDDTIPQNTEGDEALAANMAIAPFKSPANIIDVEATLMLSSTNSSSGLAAALFFDSDTSAVAATFSGRNAAASGLSNITLMHTALNMNAAGAVPTQARVRVGNGVAGTTTINGIASARIFGNRASSQIVVREIMT